MEIVREEYDKKTQILKAAVSVFSEKGFHSSTMDMISEAASVGKGTVYLYFSGKEELLGELIYRAVKAQVEEAKERLAISDSIERLKEVLAVGRLFLDKGTDLAKVIMRESVEVMRNPNFRERLYLLHEEYLKLVVRSLEMGQEDGTFRKDFSPVFVGNLLVSLRAGIGAELIQACAHSISEEFIDDVMEFILKGIGAPVI